MLRRSKPARCEAVHTAQDICQRDGLPLLNRPPPAPPVPCASQHVVRSFPDIKSFFGARELGESGAPTPQVRVSSRRIHLPKLGKQRCTSNLLSVSAKGAKVAAVIGNVCELR